MHDYRRPDIKKDDSDDDDVDWCLVLCLRILSISHPPFHSAPASADDDEAKTSYPPWRFVKDSLNASFWNDETSHVMRRSVHTPTGDLSTSIKGIVRSSFLILLLLLLLFLLFGFILSPSSGADERALGQRTESRRRSIVA